ncbi:GTPase regulator Nrf1 [Mycoemilia scoparia]|uniref:GTPase regulator Nrf1 n=1 Tax=Mycoemilia scoparia TaxID=417184 RepID=A0A9W7ZVF9_9FUNG|nr:GTPase regulator Nrf1 [Mycoemilia scoparia]
MSNSKPTANEEETPIGRSSALNYGSLESSANVASTSKQGATTVEPHGSNTTQGNNSNSNVSKSKAQPLADFSQLRPKNFFANERTFLSWLQLAVVMGGLGLALLNFGPSNHFKVLVSAFVFETGALALIAYAYIEFMSRTSRLRSREAGTYDNLTLPVLIVLFFVFATAINFGLTFHKKAYIPPLYNIFSEKFLLWIKP